MNLPINSNMGLKVDLFSSLGQASFGPNVAKVANAIDKANFSQFNSQERQTLSTLTNALASDGDISSADAKSLLSTINAFAPSHHHGHHDHGHHHDHHHTGFLGGSIAGGLFGGSIGGSIGGIFGHNHGRHHDHGHTHADHHGGGYFDQGHTHADHHPHHGHHPHPGHGHHPHPGHGNHPQPTCPGDIILPMPGEGPGQTVPIPGGGNELPQSLKQLLIELLGKLSDLISQIGSDRSFQSSVDGLMENVASSPWKGAVEGALENVDLSKLNPSERSELLSMLSVASADGEINFPESSVILNKLNDFTGSDFSTDPVHPCEPWDVVQNGSTAEIDLGDHTLTINENKSEFILTNKETGESSRVWGDPHFDMDNDGKTDVDFWGTMTMNLENGTKITIETTPWNGNEDMTVSSKLTITQGDQQIVVDGMDQNEKGDMTIIHSQTGGRLTDAHTADGLDIYQAGDGNEWKILDGCVMRDVTQADMNQTKDED